MPADNTTPAKKIASPSPLAAMRELYDQCVADSAQRRPSYDTIIPCAECRRVTYATAPMPNCPNCGARTQYASFFESFFEDSG